MPPKLSRHDSVVHHHEAIAHLQDLMHQEGIPAEDRMHAFMDALDENHDGEITQAELAHAVNEDEVIAALFGMHAHGVSPEVMKATYRTLGLDADALVDVVELRE
jgi:hypothetical protein